MEGRTSAHQNSSGGFPPRHNKRVGRTGQPTRREARLQALLLLLPQAGPLLFEVRGVKEDREEDWARSLGAFFFFFTRLNWW